MRVIRSNAVSAAFVGCAALLIACSSPSGLSESISSASSQASPTLSPSSATTPVSSSPVSTASPAQGSIPSQSTPPSAYGYAVAGEAAFQNEDGYTYKVGIDWNASFPVTDVAANPPGKTDIVIERTTPLAGTFTNTTVGGRAFPASRIPSLQLVAIYPASSAACAQGVPMPYNSGGWVGGGLRSSENCAIRLETVLGVGVADRVFDGTRTLPNGTPMSFTANDLAFVVTQPSTGPHWKGVDEATVPELVAALEEPLAMGVYSFTLQPTSSHCIYQNATDGGAEFVAILDSNFGVDAPGCS